MYIPCTTKRHCLHIRNHRDYSNGQTCGFEVQTSTRCVWRQRKSLALFQGIPTWKMRILWQSKGSTNIQVLRSLLLPLTLHFSALYLPSYLTFCYSMTDDKDQWSHPPLILWCNLRDTRFHKPTLNTLPLIEKRFDVIHYAIWTFAVLCCSIDCYLVLSSRAVLIGKVDFWRFYANCGINVIITFK